MEALRWWHSRLTARGRPRRIFSDSEEEGCLWDSSVLSTLPPDDALNLDSGPYAVITTDASGFASGAWWGNRRLHYPFTREQLQGLYGGSANLRELFLPPWVLEQWQPRDMRILFRMDSAASVGAINHRGSMVPHFNELVHRMIELLEALGCEAVARHLPGKHNVLADGISRLEGRRDLSDWMFDSYVFEEISAAVGPFTVDACSDDLGHNSLCARHWSPNNSALQQQWAGLHVWWHSPFALAATFLRHFWGCIQQQPYNTSAVFLLPAWPSVSWWRLLRGGRVVAHFPAGSQLFSRPDWALASRTCPLPRSRVPGAPTDWAVVAVMFPCALPRNGAGIHHRQALPCLRGMVGSDFLLLRRLPAGVVPSLRGASPALSTGAVCLRGV